MCDTPSTPRVFHVFVPFRTSSWEPTSPPPGGGFVPWDTNIIARPAGKIVKHQYHPLTIAVGQLPARCYFEIDSVIMSDLICIFQGVS